MCNNAGNEGNVAPDSTCETYARVNGRPSSAWLIPRAIRSARIRRPSSTASATSADCRCLGSLDNIIHPA
jgi:hypothetical protein